MAFKKVVYPDDIWEKHFAKYETSYLNATPKN